MSFLDLRRFPPRRLFLFVLLVACVGAGLWFVHSRGGWHGLIKIQPILDSSTPRSQNGFSLVSILVTDAPGDQTAFSLLVRPASFPPCQSIGTDTNGVMQYEPSGKQSRLPLQASARMSSGDITPLLCDIIGTNDAPQFLRIKIPGGYSNDCRFADITLVPDSGPFVHWRIAGLPYMRQMISDSPAITEQVTKSGITVTAHAYRVRHAIFLRTVPNLPPGSHQWELVRNSSSSQYEKFDPNHKADASYAMPITTREGVLLGNDLSIRSILDTWYPAAYRSASRFVRLDCALRQFEIYDEQVTFPNVALERSSFASDGQTYYVSVPETVTLLTPRGLAVTLPKQGADNNHISLGYINLSLSVKPNPSPAELPHTPLNRQYAQPITVNVQFPAANGLGGWIENGEIIGYAARVPENLKSPDRFPHLSLAPPTRRNFTILLHERVDLQTLPMTFTVPVLDKMPPNFRW